jgi:hypothetical protein
MGGAGTGSGRAVFSICQGIVLEMHMLEGEGGLVLLLLLFGFGSAS